MSVIQKFKGQLQGTEERTYLELSVLLNRLCAICFGVIELSLKLGDFCGEIQLLCLQGLELDLLMREWSIFVAV